MKVLPLIFLAAILFSCNNITPVKAVNAFTDKVITAGEQKNLSPDSVISMLKNGNEDFYNHRSTLKNDSLRIHLTAHGQYPMAAVLSCIDSRVPVEEVFNMGIGDLFVARVAGNIENQDILGSLEYACKVSGAKVIMILGHEHCGAIKSAIDNVQMGNITALLTKIQPAVEAVKTDGARSSKNELLVHEVAIKNVELTIKKIRTDSEILNKMEQEQKIKIVGGIYDLDSGKITFF
jgi:carbonic anhydrase